MSDELQAASFSGQMPGRSELDVSIRDEVGPALNAQHRAEPAAGHKLRRPAQWLIARTHWPR